MCYIFIIETLVIFSVSLTVSWFPVTVRRVFSKYSVVMLFFQPDDAEYIFISWYREVEIEQK